MIPTRHGKDGQYEVTVPTVADRVVQAALKLVLEPDFEADFQPCSLVHHLSIRVTPLFAEWEGSHAPLVPAGPSPCVLDP